ncbi:MAG: DUF503 domain-containing protein [Spirochaetia bacterium]
MVVSLVQYIIYLPDASNLKDKRRTVQTLTKRLQNKYNITAAEIDLQESVGYSQVGAALVSNSKKYGDQVVQKIIAFVEDEIPGRIYDISTHTEFYD